MNSAVTPGELNAVVRQAQAGHEPSRRQLVERTLPVVHRILHRLVGRRADVDDLVQMVYARAFRSLDTFRGEAAFTTWLGTICVNVATSYWKSRRQRTEGEAESVHLSVVGRQDAERQVLAREGLRHLLSVLEAMTVGLRSAFVLHVLEGYDIETVAAMTSSSVGATYKSIERARKHIEVAANKNTALAQFLDEGGRS